MEEVKIETGVDDLISLLRKEGKLGLKEAAQRLKVGESFVQAWVDFLVEEKILGMEYKFTKPYIFLNDIKTADSISKPRAEAIENIHEEAGLETIKKAYFLHASKKHIPQEKVDILWKKHVLQSLEKRKEFFFREAKKRKLQDPEGLFIQYSEKLLKV